MSRGERKRKQKAKKKRKKTEGDKNWKVKVVLISEEGGEGKMMNETFSRSIYC